MIDSSGLQLPLKHNSVRSEHQAYSAKSSAEGFVPPRRK